MQALQRIPAGEWPKDEAKPLLDAIVGVRPQGAGRRAHDAGGARRAAVRRLAGRRCCRRTQAQAARKELGELGVRVLRVGTVTEQMLFDKDRLVVQAGKPVEFLFENTDMMPHNFVIIAAGRRWRRSATLAETTGDAARAPWSGTTCRSRTRCC